MCEKCMSEELCDMIFEKAQPKSESYRKKLSKAVEARSKLEETLTEEQKRLLEKRDNALGECNSEERLLAFKLTFKLAFSILKGLGEMG